MKKLIKIFLASCLLLSAFSVHSQGIQQKLGPAFADNLDSLFTHSGLQMQPVFVLGRSSANDGFGAWYVYDSTSTATPIPYQVFAVTGRSTGRWILIQLISSGGGDSTVFNSPDYAVIDILTTPPGSPTDQDKYLAGVGSAGAWIGQDNDIETWDAGGSAWTPTVPTIGQLLIRGTDDHMWKFTASGWIDITSTLPVHKGGDNYGPSNLYVGNKANKAFGFLSNNILRGMFNNAGHLFLYYLSNGNASTDSILVTHNGETRRVAPNSYIIDTTTLHAQIVQLRTQQTTNNTNIQKNTDSITAHNTRILNEAIARDNADIKTLGVTGTTTKTITLTKGDATTITGTFTDQTGGSSSVVFDSLTWIRCTSVGILSSNSEATNTANATTAIRYLINHGGGTLFFPIDTPYHVQIIIPAIPSDSICNIRILGATPPEQRAGTIGDSSVPLAKKGAILISNATSGGGVIYVNATSKVTVTLQNLDIRTYDNPQISGIEIYNANRCYIDNCFVNTNIFNRGAHLPTTLTYGIRTPAINNGASVYITNTTIGGGYYVGLSANEHTCGDNINIYSCFRGLQVVAGYHEIHFGRIALSANNINIYALGANVLNIDALDVENIDSVTQTTPTSAWQVTQFDLKDTANLLSGTINWWTTHGSSGVHGVWTQTGGTYVATKEAAFGFSSTNVSTTSANLYYNLGKIGIGTSSPSALLHANLATTGDGIIVGNGTITSSISLGANDVQYGTQTNHDVSFFTNNTKQIGISRTGGMGIGTGSTYINSTLPSGYLFVKNGLAIGSGTTPTGIGLDVLVADNTYAMKLRGATITASWYAGSSDFEQGTETNHNYTFYTNSIRNLNISAGGGIGIGSNAGGYMSTSFAQGYAFIQNGVSIGATSIPASAILSASSTTKGFLPPVMTTTQRNAISSPATGLIVFCSDCTATDASTGVNQTYNGSTWKNWW